MSLIMTIGFFVVLFFRIKKETKKETKKGALEVYGL